MTSSRYRSPPEGLLNSRRPGLLGLEFNKRNKEEPISLKCVFGSFTILDFCLSLLANARFHTLSYRLHITSLCSLPVKCYSHACDSQKVSDKSLAWKIFISPFGIGKEGKPSLYPVAKISDIIENTVSQTPWTLGHSYQRCIRVQVVNSEQCTTSWKRRPSKEEILVDYHLPWWTISFSPRLPVAIETWLMLVCVSPVMIPYILAVLTHSLPVLILPVVVYVVAGGLGTAPPLPHL